MIVKASFGDTNHVCNHLYSLEGCVSVSQPLDQGWERQSSTLRKKKKAGDFMRSGPIEMSDRQILIASVCIASPTRSNGLLPSSGLLIPFDYRDLGLPMHADSP